MPIVLPDDGGRTYLDLQNDALGDDFDAGKYRVSVKQWINDALQDIARVAHIPGLEATWSPDILAGEASYELPSDKIRLLSAFGDDSRPLGEVAIEDIDTTPAGSGRPVEFAQSGGNVVFYPAPDQAYTVTFRYLTSLAALTADIDAASLEIPDAYADMVVAFVRSRLFRKEDDVQMSQFWRSEYERDLLRLKADVQRRSRSRVRQIPGPYGRPSYPRFQRP
jgi:hypothetical protein